MKKERYIEWMAMALSAYTDEHIDSYFERVKKEGITEHGFPRLTANIGILLCRGYRENLYPIFLEMMDFCVSEMPKARTEKTQWAGNDFALTGAKKLVFFFLAFDFDGETKTDIEVSETAMRVTYEGYTCTYETGGKILFKDEYADNRNGRYRVYYATAEDALSLHISIEEVKE